MTRFQPERRLAWPSDDRFQRPAVFAAQFALMLGDRSRARTSVSELTRIVREHDLPLFRAFESFSKAGRPKTPDRPPTVSRCA
jgi:hypothetical protein